jgi:hypothetical protein
VGREPGGPHLGGHGQLGIVDDPVRQSEPPSPSTDSPCPRRSADNPVVCVVRDLVDHVQEVIDEVSRDCVLSIGSIEGPGDRTADAFDADRLDSCELEADPVGNEVVLTARAAQ